MEVFIDKVIAGAAIVLVFGLAVFVHEFGHMIFALIRGVGVESFAIGMGPKICAWKWGGIEFSLRWLPVGGFVKLQGMLAGLEEEAAADGDAPTDAPAQAAAEVEEKPDAEKEASLAESSFDDLLALSNKGLLTKLMVFGGGVFMNFVAALAAMVVLQMLPKDAMLIPIKVWEVTENTPPAAAGLRAGDVVVAVNGEPVEFPYQMSRVIEASARAAGISPRDKDAISSFTVALTVANGAEGATRQIEPLAVGHWFNFVDQEMPPIVNSVQVGQPADKAGIQGGDRFLSVNGAPVETFNKFASIIRVHLDKEMILEIQRGDEVVTLNVTPSMFPLDATQGAIGITAGAAENTKIPGESFGQALAYAPGDTWQTLVNIVELNVQFLRNASFRQIREGVGGPVLIARMTARAAQEGINELVHFFIILNLLLLIFNLLPVPVLDGGFILISVVESVIRRPIPPRVLMPVYTFFVIFFIGLMLVITLWDVKRWIS